MTGERPGVPGTGEGWGDEESAPWSTREDLLVLHAVRLAGFSDARGVAARAELPVEDVVRVLDDLHATGAVERFAFADTAGWILTEEGRTRDSLRLAQELEASRLRPLLAAAAERFEPVNSRFVQVVTAWQLQPPADNDDRATELLRSLTDIATILDEVLAAPVRHLPRLGRYSHQYRAALDRARAGELDWVAGVGKLSCHTIWAELHQDLLSTLGHDRSAGSPTER